MKFGKRFSLLAALTLTVAFFPVLSAQAQDKSGCTLSADDCKLVAAAEANIVKETPLIQDFELKTSTGVGLQQTSLQVTGKGPVSHDPTVTDVLNSYQLQLDLSGARKGSGNDSAGTVGLVLTGGVLYFKTDTIPWTGVKTADLMPLLGMASGTTAAGTGATATPGGLRGGMVGFTGGLDPTQIIGLLGFSNMFAAIIADPSSKDYLKQAKTTNTPTLEDQKMSEFLYTFDLKNLQGANSLAMARSLIAMGGNITGSTAMPDAQFKAFLALSSADSTMTVTRWVGQTDNEYHALGLDLTFGFKPFAGASDGATLTETTHFLIKLTQVGQPVTIKPPDGAKVVALQQFMGVFVGVMGGTGGGVIPPSVPQAAATATK